MQSEIIILVVIINLILVILIIGIVFFIMQYRKRRMQNEKERKVADELHQKELLSIQLDSQQHTMQHIGIEIHDNVGQKLTLASLYTKQLATGTANNMESKIAEVGSIIDESLIELRQLSKTLTNPELANATITTLLIEEAKRINASGICHVSINSKEDVFLPQAEKNILFRLLQEFIQNSLKHASCRKININIGKENEMLKVTAIDDGKGFDMATPSKGIGLQNMKRRAEQLNAAFKLESKSGEGTTLVLQLNLH
jgi:signal transduction histidine kinase